MNCEFNKFACLIKLNSESHLWDEESIQETFRAKALSLGLLKNPALKGGVKEMNIITEKFCFYTTLQRGEKNEML